MRTLRTAMGLLLLCLILALAQPVASAALLDAPERLTLRGDTLRMTWQETDAGWAVTDIRALGDDGWRELPHPLGEYGVTWSAASPNLTAVQEDRAGDSQRFLPSEGRRLPDGSLEFRHSTDLGTLIAHWTLDPENPTDVRVDLQWQAAVDGYVSLASPTLATVGQDELTWGMLPGQWYGTQTNPDYNLAVKYGQGLPASPAVKFEHTTTTLAPMIQTTGGLTVAAVPDPGTGRDPYRVDRPTHRDWQLGLSTMNRSGQLTPQLYSPVLGGTGSWTSIGETKDFPFRFSVAASDWWELYNHVVYDLYSFKRSLTLKDTQESLSTRLGRIQRYLEDPVSSRWRVDDYQGTPIGAQDYLGLVKEADGDAMKNSDVGAMEMAATALDSTVTECDRLPYVRNFKLAQQTTAPGYFQGAPTGQYYLHKSNRFVEEYGPYVEPLGVSYYTMIDMANMLAFHPDDDLLRERLRLGADRLLDWQKQDGSWDVAYDRDAPHGLTFPHLTDYRPTWYGLLVAHEVLGDQKYLDAARRGADWFLENGVENGYYLGSTGDSGFLMDLSVSQSAQGLAELARRTHDDRYLDAAIEVAKVYTTWVYTHPVVSDTPKMRNGSPVPDWAITQVGLQKEQNATAAFEGPILLNSHAGTFLRFYQVTGDRLFRDMARSGALGRDAFTDPSTGVQSYYWSKFDQGPGPFPHHGWWQIGWITDYLLSEAKMRSDNAVNMPHGPFTPKVGGQVTYGAEPGMVFGQQARLHMPPGMLTTDDPHVDVLGFSATARDRILAVLLNDSDRTRETSVTINPDRIESGRTAQVTGARAVHGRLVSSSGNAAKVAIRPWGLAAVAFDITPGPGEFTPPTLAGPPDQPTVTWAHPDAETGALDFRIEGTQVWTRNPASATCRGFEAALGPVTPLPATVEFRLVATDKDGTEQLGPVHTTRLYDPENPGPNLALGQIATASSSLRADTGPERAVDGNHTDATSRWISAQGDTTPRLQIHLTSPATLDLLRLHTGFASPADTVAGFEVELLVDGQWTRVGAVTGNRETRVDVPIQGGVRSSDVRLTFTDPSSTTPDIARVFEVELFGRR